MFDRYVSPRVAGRLRNSPDADWLASFVHFLHDRGHSRLTLQTYLRQAVAFGRWLRHRHRTLASLTDADGRAFAARPPGRKRRHVARAAVAALVRHLRGRGLVPQRPAPASPAIERAVAEYEAHLCDAAGLAPATRLYRRRYAREFLRSVFADGPIRWAELRIDHVRAFVSGYGTTRRLAAARVAAVGLRSFLRWLNFTGRVGPALIAAVPHYPQWRLAALPPVLSDAQVAAFLARFESESPAGRRNRAIALCLLDLGLRVGEVAALTLDDLDATTDTLRLGAGKSRRDRLLPMTERVRSAVCAYLRNGRPTTTSRSLFVRDRTLAGRPVTRELIRGIIRRAYAHVPGCERRTGTHLLRHTAASRLLRAGADLKQIADILGHRSLDTTAVYAKIDDDRLVTVARPWPKAGEVRS